MNKEIEQSLSRSKKSLLKFCDFVAETTASSVPGGVPVYKLSKILVEHAHQFYKDRREQRLIDFHGKVLEEGTVQYWDSIKDKEFSIDEYYSLLNNVIQDEEDKKVDIYAKIFRLILLEKIPEKYRSHIIKSSRELTYSDFELMRTIYINEKYEFKAPGNITIQVRNITQPKSPLETYSIQTLIRFGYLSEGVDNKPPWPTELLKKIVECLYEENELKA